MRKLIKTLVAIVLIISITIPNVLAIGNTKANTEKEEIVYISLDTDGSTKGVYVVNAFEMEEDGEIVDYGNYDNITNLTDNSEIKVNNEEITVNTKKGMFFYQGDNPQKELPWIIDIKYYLEGKEVDKTEIAGSSGEIEIKGKITRNPKADSVFSKYFLGQLSISIDSKKAIVKKAEGSTLGYNGSVQLLNYSILPESDLEFSIILDSKSFEMEPFTFSAVPFNMDFEMPDTSVITDNLGQLESAIKSIDGGTSKITKGAIELNDSTKLLLSNLELIYGGLIQTKNGQERLKNGTLQFDNGLSQYESGINQLVQQMTNLTEGMTQLKFGLSKLTKGSNQLDNGILEFSNGLSQYTTGISDLSDGHIQLTNGIKFMGDSSKELISGGRELSDASEKIYDGLAIFDYINITDNISLEDLKKLEPIIDEILEFWDEINTKLNNLTNEDIKNGLIEARDKIQEVIDSLSIYTDLNIPVENEISIENIADSLAITDLDNPDVQKLLLELEKSYKTFKSIKDKLSDTLYILDLYIVDKENLEEIVQLISEMRNESNEKLLPLKKALQYFNAEKFYNDIKEIEGFRTSYKKFHDGLLKYTEGTNKLVNAINNDLLSGSEDFDKGIALLNNSSKKLVDSSAQLSYGSKQISTGLAQILSRLDFSDVSRINELNTGIDILSDNHSLILFGQEELSQGLVQLTNGLRKYINGFGKYSNGFEKFTGGLNELQLGISQLSDETNGMTNSAQEQIDEAMSKYTKQGFELKSFVNKNNKNIKHLQFAYVSDAIKVVEEKNKEEIVEKQSFFEKLWDIITFWD